MAINDKILDAVDILTKASINNANYDKTIIAQIVSCENKETGKYKCNYQGAIIYAYASYPTMVFNSGDNVYVLIVGEDATGEGKIIIGKRY